MAKPNFSFQKRQKELEKKKKNDEKLERKRMKNLPQTDENPDQAPEVHNENPDQTPEVQ